MARCVVWIEGVDFSETLFDTHKLSVVRGASRALETMPEAAITHFQNKKMNPQMVVRGASISALLVDADETNAQKALQEFCNTVLQQGMDEQTTKTSCEAISKNSREGKTVTNEDIIKAAPFAQLKFHSAVVPCATNIQEALGQAHARVRVAQLKTPGSTISKSNALAPCEWDMTRAPSAKVTYGPPRSDNETSSPYSLSTATAARWHFGRMERQLIYNNIGVTERFTDDFQTMVKDPPKLPEGTDLPVSVRNKIAVFSADGDKFGSEVIPAVIAACHGDQQLGLTTFSKLMKQRMEGLLKGLVDGLTALPPDAARVEDYRDKSSAPKRLRFETLLFGGEDLCFVVPAWLGWWLALKFFELTNAWEITASDITQLSGKPPPGNFKNIPMSFSAGLLFANVKTPIRSLRMLADELVKAVKGAPFNPRGGLDVEVLESIEPPHGGLKKHRERFVQNPANSAIRRHHVSDRLTALSKFWTDNKSFPASQAHRILHDSLVDRKLGATSTESCQRALQAYVDGPGTAHREKLNRIGCLEGCELDAFNLYLALQQRDFVRAHQVTQ